ncbi:MAG: hypothetical protein AAF108_09310 [Planctomycetota bacterium]
MTAEQPPRTADKRRRLWTLLVGVSATLCVALAAAGLHELARTLDLRYDVTATRSHAPTPDTLRLLDELPGPTDVVVIGSLTSPTIDAWSARRVRDTLDELDRRSDRLTVEYIDPALPDGAQRARALLRSLVQRDGDRLASAADALRRATDALRAGLDSTRRLEVSAGLADQLQPALEEVGRRLDAADASISRRVEDVAVPAVGPATATLAQLTDAFGRIAAAISAEGVDAGGVASAATLAADALAELPFDEPASSAVASVLTTEEAVVIAGPSGARAVPLASLFPPPPADASVGISADAGPRAEAQVATALRALAGERGPLVVFTHGEAADVFDDSTELDGFRRRLERLGYEVVQWAPVLEPEPPAVVETVTGRAVVYVVIGTDASSAGPGGAHPGPERAAAVAVAIGQILGRGSPALVCLAPSPLPAFGTPDPVAEVLQKIGVTTRTERPLLTTERGAAGSVVTPDHTALGASVGSDEPRHPVGRAVASLGLRLPWPIPLEPSGDGGAGASALLRLGEAGSDRVWSETSWLTFRGVAPERRGLLAAPPKPDPERGELGGPWTVAMAVERAGGARAVVVGSNRWLLDEFVEADSFVDGRRVLTSPGNAELLEASLAWLSGGEVVSGRSATVPRVRAVSGAGLTALRVVVAGGLPLGVLALGGLVLFLRR